MKNSLETQLKEGLGIAPHAWRIIWTLTKESSEVLVGLSAYAEAVIRVLPNRKDGHQRELLKLLFAFEIPEEWHGLLWEACLVIWTDLKKQSSVRIKALTHMVALVQYYPDLKHELSYCLDGVFVDSLSSGIRRSTFVKLMRDLDKILNSKT